MVYRDKTAWQSCHVCYFHAIHSHMGKKEIFPFKNVFFTWFQILFRGHLDTDRDMDSYTVKRKSEAWGGDMLLTKMMCNAARVCRI
jgi:hypothetical protein